MNCYNNAIFYRTIETIHRWIGRTVTLYQTDDGQTKIQVKMEDETVWLTQDQMADFFNKGRTTIIEHIQNVFKEGELDEKSVCREFRRTGTDRKEYGVKHYNLDVIISVGYMKRLTGTC